MSICYIDTSVLVAILFDEPEVIKVRKIITRYDRLVSHHLVESELFSVFNRQKIELDAALSILDTIEIIYPNNSFRQDTMDVVTKYEYLRGADLLHIACAKWLSCNKPSKLGFLSLDQRQYSVAKKIGFDCNL